MVVVFDFDGTMADTFEQTVALVKELYPDLTEKEVKMYRENGARETLKKLDISSFSLLRWVIKIQKKQYQIIEKAEMFDGMGEVIAKLRGQGIEVGILTSNSRENVEKWLEINKIKVDWVKVEKMILGKARALKKIKILGQAQDEMVYVGDEVRDVEACKKAGVKIIAVDWGFNSRLALEKHNPDFVVSSPSEILEIVKVLATELTRV